MKKYSIVMLLMLAALVTYAGSLKLPKIDVKTPAANYARMCEYKVQADLPSVEKLIAPSFKDWNADFRSCDLSQMDLSMYPSNLADYIDYDSKTKWPAKDKMPVGFNPKKYLKEGRNPGLHVRDLHRRGIDGRGVSIAIIDQPLLTTHQEYKKNLKLYESFEPSFWGAAMHGPAVVSIAVGKTVGVAPKADLFYIAGRFESAPQEKERFNALPIAHALERIIEINNALPPAKRIRVVSISRGFCLDEKECGKYTDLGAKEFREAVNLLNKKGVAVFTTNDLFTVSRSGAQADADDNNSYTRGAYWWPDKELPGYAQWDILLFPTDFRVTAAPNGNKDYVAYANGGMSWAVPYAAGLYALGAQVYPDLTPELFWKLLKETAVPTPPLQGINGPIDARGKYLAQPVAFIEKLESMKKK